MSILKATLWHLLQRKWKLTLVVFLFGTALVAMTHTNDVAGVLGETDVAVEGLQEGTEPPSEGQGEALARGFGVLVLFGVLNFLFSFGMVLVGMLMPSGVVANERRSGAIMLWAQHPMPLRRFYLQRYMGIQLANVAAQAVFGVTAVLAILPQGSSFPETEAGVFVRVCLLGTMACAVSFGITALGIRRAAFLALAYYTASGLASGVIAVAVDAGVAGAWGTMLGALRFVIFPNNAIGDFVTGFESGVAWDWRAAGTLLYHFALWTGIAWLGLLRIERRPLKL